ncbi:MAG: glycoside hydrolase family 75 protein [Chthoniobacterales bacterium]
MRPPLYRSLAGTAVLLIFPLIQISCKKAEVVPPTNIVPSATPTNSPTPTPTPFIGRKPMDISRLFNGMLVETKLSTQSPGTTAIVERNTPESYKLQLTVDVALPQAAITEETLAEANPKLPHILNDMQLLLKTAKVSPDFEKFYDLKLRNIRERLSHIDALLSMHNLYDCDTILLLKHPESGRRAVLIQADMDVNTDGSDGDRNIPDDSSSILYQPQTSYRWKKLTERPNRVLAPTEKKLAEAKAQYEAGNHSAEKKHELKEHIEHLKSQAEELQHFSFLVATADPFIVLPGFMVHRKDDPFSPEIGDYAIVIYHNSLYPAIVGDVGPAYKIGEASLRICKEIVESSSAMSRPVDTLEVSYLIFPKTADGPFTQPNLEKWHDMCQKFLQEIGGSPVELHQWDNLVKPWPTPTPEPTPTPIPVPTPDPASTETSGVFTTPETSPTPSPLSTSEKTSPSPTSEVSTTPN